MAVRRYAAFDIPAPFNTRLKTRLERAVAQAIVNPSRALPTLRRAVLVASDELRQHQFGDEEIRNLFSQLIEDVVRSRALDTRSIVSGQPRWMDVREKVITWATSTTAL
jgi:hypothetical protein